MPTKRVKRKPKSDITCFNCGTSFNAMLLIPSAQKVLEAAQGWRKLYCKVKYNNWKAVKSRLVLSEAIDNWKRSQS